jgi:hypothetical protein
MVPPERMNVRMAVALIIPFPVANYASSRAGVPSGNAFKEIYDIQGRKLYSCPDLV